MSRANDKPFYNNYYHQQNNLDEDEEDPEPDYYNNDHINTSESNSEDNSLSNSIFEEEEEDRSADCPDIYIDNEEEEIDFIKEEEEEEKESFSSDDYSYEENDSREETIKSETSARRLGFCPFKYILSFLTLVDKLAAKMINFACKYHKELFVILILIASALSSLKNGVLETRSQNFPGPFFCEKSKDLIQDNFNGDYIHLVNKQIPVSPSFIFYYAPWDIESILAKKVFHAVAQYFNTYRNASVKFYAVNCWYPEGECRRNYKNLSHFPIFVGHFGGISGIIYNGPIREELMIRFLLHLLKPLTRIDTEEELFIFRAEHDSIMLAHFNFSQPESSQSYEVYLQMALRNHESDPFGSQVGFGLFLNPELAQKFFLTSSNTISLVLFNEIHTAKWNSLANHQELKAAVTQVCDWINERTKSLPIKWIYKVRSGFSNRAIGAVDFSKELTKGPIFLLVSKRYFPTTFSPFYSQIKEVALDYFNCNHSGNVTKLRKSTHRLIGEWMSLQKSVYKLCSPELYDPTNYFCEHFFFSGAREWEEKKKIKYQRESLASYEIISNSLNFTGLSCRSQRKFQFLAVDPIDNPHFVPLAFDSSALNSDEHPFAYIIDSENEILIPFNSFNISDLALTIVNFTKASENKLEPGPNTIFSENQFWSQENKFVINKEHNQNSKSGNKNEDQENISQMKKSPIKKFNSEELLDYLIYKGPYRATSLLLMYTAKFCGFCGTALAQFVQLGNFLKNYSVNVTLGKLDVFWNSLPPYLSPLEIPVFVYFPANNHSQMKIFPEDEKIDSKTLLNFLLTNLEAEARIQASFESSYCSNNNNANNTLSNDRANCLKSNKNQVSQKIHSILREISLENSNPPFEDDESVVPLENQNWRIELLNQLRSLQLNLEVS